jgi:tRNA(Ile)-lysidine synthase TilS/MesJ
LDARDESMKDTDKGNPAEAEEILGRNRCSSCVLPLSLEMADFDAQDTCRYCRESRSEAASAVQKDEASEKLESEIEHIRKLGEGRPYDAVIGLSGGLFGILAGQPA